MLRFPVKLQLMLFLGVASAFAGQSLVLTPGVTSTAVNDPNLPQQQAWRVEFQLHDWVSPTVNTNDATIWDLNGIGAAAALLPGGLLRFFDKRDVSPGVCSISLGSLTNVLIRVQRDPLK